MSPASSDQVAVMAAASLFSAGPRTRLDPRGHTESEYSFLDQSSREPVARVREVLDAWYSRLPVAARASIRNRFSSPDQGHHLGALWEMYLHEAFLRLDHDVDLDIGREDPTRRRPDFRLARGGVSFYLEATAVLGDHLLGDQSSQARAGVLCEAIERVEAPDFFLGVGIDQCGTTTPGRRHVTQPLQRWLDGLDADLVLSDYDVTEEVPRMTLSFDGWKVECSAIPVAPEHRGDPGHRVIGSLSQGVGELNDAKPLRTNLKGKTGVYGTLDQPFVVALLCAGDFADDKDVADALLGSTGVRYNLATRETSWTREPDGFWHGPRGPQNTSVSAVVTIPQLSSSAITAVEPTVWLNPWATRPFVAQLPWRTQEMAPDGRITTHDAARTPADLFELPERWPREG
jgi:hypothetical protein